MRRSAGTCAGQNGKKGTDSSVGLQNLPPITSLCQTASLEGTCGSDRNAVLLGSNSAFATQDLLEADAGHYTTTHERVLHTVRPSSKFPFLFHSHILGLGRSVMNILWGCLIAAVGLFLFVSGTTKSEFVVYRLLVARSKGLWGERVLSFYQVAGILVTGFGVLFAAGVIK